MTKERITQREQVAIFVRFKPGCVLGEVCHAVNAESGVAGRLLNELLLQGIVTRVHNGTQYAYTAIPDAAIPDIELPFMAPPADLKNIQSAERIAKGLERRGYWRRAATVYTEMLAMADSSTELWRIASQRSKCLRMARRA